MSPLNFNRDKLPIRKGTRHRRGERQTVVPQITSRDRKVVKIEVSTQGRSVSGGVKGRKESEGGRHWSGSSQFKYHQKKDFRGLRRGGKKYR